MNETVAKRAEDMDTDMEACETCRMGNLSAVCMVTANGWCKK